MRNEHSAARVIVLDAPSYPVKKRRGELQAILESASLKVEVPLGTKLANVEVAEGEEVWMLAHQPDYEDYVQNGGKGIEGDRIVLYRGSSSQWSGLVLADGSEFSGADWKGALERSKTAKEVVNELKTVSAERKGVHELLGDLASAWVLAPEAAAARERVFQYVHSRWKAEEQQKSVVSWLGREAGIHAREATLARETGQNDDVTRLESCQNWLEECRVWLAATRPGELKRAPLEFVARFL